MIPQPQQYVQIYFKNALKLEGFVEFWGDKKATLKSIDEKNYCIINNMDEILFYTIKIEIRPQSQLQQEFDRQYNKPSADPDRIKSLADLKIELNQQEKMIQASKLKEHSIGTENKVKYGYPTSLMRRSK